jgi:hypothetical protein
MTPDEKAELKQLANQTGIPLSEAFRLGATQYYSQQLNGESDPLVAEVNALAAKLNNRLSSGS